MADVDMAAESSEPPPINFGGVIKLAQMCLLLDVSDETIRAHVREGTFPVKPITGAGNRLRWWGPTVKQWLDTGAVAAPRPRPRRRRRA